MNVRQKVAIILASAGLVVGGCAAASHISGLQPPKVPDPSTITAPAGCTAVTSGKSFTLECASYKRGQFQRGIDIDWYAYRGQDVSSGAAWTIRYITSLHANAVSVSIPFFENGDGVHRTSATPSPAQVAVLVTDARDAGLYVSLRPLLDGALPHGQVRTRFVPANATVWFRSYAAFLKPYLQMARREHVNQFIVGAELSQMSHDKQWKGVVTEARKDYAGQLACADNWDHVVKDGCDVSLQTVDAYHPQFGNLTSSWERWLATMPHGIAATEVGIAAAKGANSAPWNTQWPVKKLDTAAQATWFTDACHAAVHEHLAGIYFWSIGVGTKPPAGPTLESQTNIGGAGIRAIRACFKALVK